MLKFYYHPSPNPAKVALFLEESGLEYEVVPVDTRKGEQFSPAFLEINPNGKTPALVDGDAKIFDSNAILLYLAEKSGQFLPEKTDAARGQMLSWLMFVATGIGPYSGQAVHFQHFAPEKLPYAINRYVHEAKRHFGLLDAQLGKHKYMLGDTYTLVDMSVWGWARVVPFVLGEKAFDEPAEPEASFRRDQRKAGSGSRAGAERKIHLQDRDGRGCPSRSLPAERQIRSLTVAAANSRAGSWPAPAVRADPETSVRLSHVCPEPSDSIGDLRSYRRACRRCVSLHRA